MIPGEKPYRLFKGLTGSWRILQLKKIILKDKNVSRILQLK